MAHDPTAPDARPPTVVLNDPDTYGIGVYPPLPGRHVVHVSDALDLVGTLAELENVAYNVLALISSQRLVAYRELGGEL